MLGHISRKVADTSGCGGLPLAVRSIKGRRGRVISAAFILVSAPKHIGLNALFFEPSRSGGPETYLRGLVPALAQEFPTTRFTLVTTKSGAQQLKDEGWTEFCSLLSLGGDDGQRLRRLVAEQVNFPRLASSRRLDLIHSLASMAPVFSATPSVITLHDVTFFKIRTFSLSTTIAMRTIVAKAARRAAGLITATKASRDEICTTLGLSSERFSIVPHGFGRPPVAGNQSSGQGRARYELGDEARVVLCVAAIRPHKNQMLLLHALPELPNDVVLVLAGHPEPYEKELRQVAGELGVADRVRFTGYVSDGDLEALWELSSCAVFPTRGEGFGLPVVEAMSRGVPVACSDIDVLREVGGDVPYYFSPDDASGAARAIEAALLQDADDDAGKLRAAGFSWNEAAHGTFAAYERALAGI